LDLNNRKKKNYELRKTNYIQEFRVTIEIKTIYEFPQALSLILSQSLLNNGFSHVNIVIMPMLFENQGDSIRVRMRKVFIRKDE